MAGPARSARGGGAPRLRIAMHERDRGDAARRLARLLLSILSAGSLAAPAVLALAVGKGLIVSRCRRGPLVLLPTRAMIDGWNVQPDQLLDVAQVSHFLGIAQR